MAQLFNKQLHFPLSGSFTGSFSGSFWGDGGGITNISASSVMGLNLYQIGSGSYTASIAPDKGFTVNTDAQISGSTTITGSLTVLNGANISGSLKVQNSIIAKTLVIDVISSSIIYSSGSNNFGDDASDRQTFTGSLYISGSTFVTGSQNVTGSINVYGGNINVNGVNVLDTALAYAIALG